MDLNLFQYLILWKFHTCPRVLTSPVEEGGRAAPEPLPVLAPLVFVAGDPTLVGVCLVVTVGVWPGVVVQVPVEVRGVSVEPVGHLSWRARLLLVAIFAGLRGRRHSVGDRRRHRGFL